MCRQSGLAAPRQALPSIFGAALVALAVGAVTTVVGASAVDADATRTLRRGQTLDTAGAVADLARFAGSIAALCTLAGRRVTLATFAALRVGEATYAAGGLGLTIGSGAKRLARGRARHRHTVASDVKVDAAAATAGATVTVVCTRNAVATSAVRARLAVDVEAALHTDLAVKAVGSRTLGVVLTDRWAAHAVFAAALVGVAVGNLVGAATIDEVALTPPAVAVGAAL